MISRRWRRPFKTGPRRPRRRTRARNSDGRLELFYIGTDNAVYHNWQTGGGGAWSGQLPMGGSGKAIAVGENHDGRLEIFYIAINDNIHHNWQLATGGWAGEHAFTDKALQIAVGRNQDRLQIFFINLINIISTKWQTATVPAWPGAPAEVIFTGPEQDLHHDRNDGLVGHWPGDQPIGDADVR